MLLGCVGGFDDVGLLAAIASTSALTADAVPWLGIWGGRGCGFGGDPCGRGMVLRDLMIGTGKAPVLNDLPLWDMAEVLLERKRVEFSGNDDRNLRGEEALRASVVKVEEVVEAENSAAAKIYADTVEAVDLPCLSNTTPGLIKRGTGGQERIT